MKGKRKDIKRIMFSVLLSFIFMFSAVNVLAEEQPTTEEEFFAEIISIDVDQGGYPGTNYMISPTASSQNEVLYKYLIKNHTTGKWKTLKGYTSENNYTWKPQEAGYYTISIHVKDKYSTKNYDTYLYKIVEVKETPPAKITNIDVKEGGYPGTSYKINPTANSQSGVLYKYLVKNHRTGKWRTLKGYTNENNYTWKPQEAGYYTISIHVKDKYSTKNYDTYLHKIVEVKETPPAKITNIDVKEGGYAGTNYMISPTASSQNVVLYKYLIKNHTTGKWKTLKGYTNESNYTWKPQEAGYYTISIHVKDKNSTQNYDTYLHKIVEVKDTLPAEITNIKVDEGGYPGTSYKINPTANSQNGVLYKYLVKNHTTGKWRTLRGYTANNIYTWVPQSPGFYTISVHVRDTYSSKNYDAYVHKIVEVKGSSIYGKTIMLDPGHGGKHISAFYEGISEIRLNNNLTKILAKKLEAEGAKVIYTRNPDSNITLTLDERTNMANKANPDVFISIHHDAYYVKGYSLHYSSYRPNVELDGAYFKKDGIKYYVTGEKNGMIYYMDKGVERSMNINTVPNYVFDETPCSAAIKSKGLATEMYKQMLGLDFIGARQNPVQDHNLFVTRRTTMPSVLVEAGPTGKFMNDSNKHSAIADNLVKALEIYFDKN